MIWARSFGGGLTVREFCGLLGAGVFGACATRNQWVPAVHQRKSGFLSGRLMSTVGPRKQRRYLWHVCVFASGFK